MLTRTLAADLARSGVRVHAICPTAIDSPMVRSNVPQSMLADYAASQPTGRLLTVDEIARVAVALIFSPLPYTPEPLVV
jgi:2-keto-3-deoxy-L-fuconate dehydrogenase